MKFIIFALLVVLVVIGFFDYANAHRSGCHRWHSCPSDRGTYICGDTGHCSGCPDNQFCRRGQPYINAKPEKNESVSLERGLKTYKEILSGSKKWDALSANEKNEVSMVLNLLKSRNNDENGSEECLAARENANSSASELAFYADRLRSCAESEDYTYDCSSEFSGARNAHSDYESQISEVQSECD